MGIAATNNIIMIEWWNEMEHIAENNYMFIAVPTIWIVIYLSIYYWFSITKLFAVHAVMNIYILYVMCEWSRIRACFYSSQLLPQFDISQLLHRL